MKKNILDTVFKFRGLQIKLMFVVVLGLIIGITPLSIYNLYNAKNDIETELTQSANDRLETISMALSNFLLSYDYVSIDSLAEKLINTDDIQEIVVKNKSNNVIVKKSSGSLNENLKQFEKTMYFRNIPIGKIEMKVSLLRQDRKIAQQYTNIVIFFTLFAGLFGILLYMTISNAILKPISRFRDSMSNIINNPSVDKRIRLDTNSRDEIADLAIIFNNMYANVFEFQKILKERNVESGLELQAANEMLAENSKLASLGEMAGNIAHEINNPLAIISGKSDKIIRLLNEPEINRTVALVEVDKIKRTTNRIVRIIKGLRTFSRNDEHDPFQMCKLASIIDTSVDLCHDKIITHDIKVSVQNNIDLNLDIECRESQIVQIFVNLIGNAIDAIASSPDRWVKLEANKISEYNIELSVTDSGKGIPSNIAKKIMEPFFTTKEKNKGTGLGLSISYAIANGHNGSLSIDTEHRHTRFVLRLPIIQPKNNELLSNSARPRPMS